MEQLTVSDIKIDVFRKDIKNIYLSVCPPTGRVRIASPLRTNKDALRLFVVTKLGWVKRSQKKFKTQERITRREYTDRESHYFLGRRYLLNVVEEEAIPKVVLKNKTSMKLYVRPGTSVSKRGEILNEWYRQHLKLLLPDLIAKWEKTLGVSAKSWRVKQMKTMWGSCNIKERRVWFNLELAKKPIHCLEYIVVHELVHLKARHHNEVFLQNMDKYMPRWKHIKAELNRLPVSHAEWNY